jgi:outer membrane protein assembly factor BamD (BamD/ComL family)
MNAVTLTRAVLVGLSTVLLVSCTETSSTSQKGFQSQYFAARTALEKGNYETASKMYARMLPQSGPLNDRIQLEYAHVMLRSGNFHKASQIAGELARGGQGDERAAALSVKGTADHEIGLKLFRDGDQANGVAQLKSAQQSFQEVLDTHPDFDPLGSLAGRNASITSRLKSLR